VCTLIFIGTRVSLCVRRERYVFVCVERESERERERETECVSV